MAEWDTAAVCARIIREARVPKGSSYASVANLLPLLNRHLRTFVVPQLLKAAEDHLSVNVDVPLVAGKDSYRLPWRSLRLLDVTLLDETGRPVVDFGRTTERQARDLTSRTGYRPRFWYFEASSVVVMPPLQSTSPQHTLRLRIARRPSPLMDSGSAWVVTDKGPGYVEVQGTQPPPLQTYDFIKGTPSFESAKDDATSTLVEDIVGGWRVSFADTSWAERLEAGDYMAPMGTSPVPQIPLDYIPVLESSVVAQIKRENGDMAGAAAAEQATAALIESANPVLEPRSTEDTTCVPGTWDLP